MDNLIQKYKLNDEILGLIQAGDNESAAHEYSVIHNFPKEKALQIVTFISKAINNTPSSERKESIEDDASQIKSIFGNALKYDNDLKSKYPSWNIDPPDLIINPRIKK